MDREDPRGPSAATSGWVTTRVAAQALGVDPRTVRKYIKQDKLEAKAEGQGVEKTYLVSIDSVYALRDARPGPSAVRENSPRGAAESSVSGDLVDLVRDLTSEVSRRSSEAAELRTRLELTERAESSIREALEQRLEAERVSREQAEQERDELRRRLDSLQEMRDALQTGAAPAEGTDTQPEQGDPETATSPPTTPGRRSWWRRFFGFE